MRNGPGSRLWVVIKVILKELPALKRLLVSKSLDVALHSVKVC